MIEAVRFLHFAEFCRAERLSGGPDPQLALIEHLSEGYSVEERVWLAGCYAACHCVPTAYMTWKEIRPAEAMDDTLVRDWLVEHWDALPVRPEMRSHRMPAKRARCLSDFAAYARGWESDSQRSYEEVWDHAIENVKYFGRYMAIKYLEMLRMTVAPELVLRDLRAKNAWSPRRTLAMLYGEHADVLADKDDQRPETLTLANNLVKILRERLLRDAGVDVSFFQLQVLLCEYREALAGGFYPGGTHDEELDYLNLVATKFDVSAVYDARRKLFDEAYLGEVSGWSGLRREKFIEWKE